MGHALSDTFVGCTPPDKTIEHHDPLKCGFYAAAFMVLCRGRSCNGMVPPPGKTWWERKKPKALFPSDFKSILLRRGCLASIKKCKLPNIAGPAFLRAHIGQNKPVAIMGYGIGRIAPHWIVICGYDTNKKTFLAYDPRGKFSSRPFKNGTKTSKDPNLPIGNRELTEAELLDFWQGWCVFDLFLWGKYHYLAIVSA